MSQLRRIERACAARRGDLYRGKDIAYTVLPEVRVLMPSEREPARAHRPRLLRFVRALVAVLAILFALGWLASLSGCEGMLIFSVGDCERYCESAGLTVRSWDPNALHCECWGIR
jgi:hypothetical protein